jgi:hypothetical protein
MPLYRVHFVNHGDHVFDAIELEHDTDEAAIEEASRLDVPSIGAGFDVWHGGPARSSAPPIETPHAHSPAF